jgi:hypothetical protein
MNIAIRAFFALAVALSTSVAARADDSSVQGRLKAASAAVHSVVIQMEMDTSALGPAASATAPRRINMLVTVASPGRAKAVVAIGPIHVETYQVDGILYLHMQPGDSWRKMSYDPANPPPQLLDLMRMAKNEQFTLLPDREDDGVTVGVVQIAMQLPAPAGMASVGPPATLTCSYDKTTYHLNSCANAAMSITFTKYDDPSNTVELPPGAASAVLIVTKTPAPAGVPSPIPTSTPAPVPTLTPAPAPSMTPSAVPSATP